MTANDHRRRKKIEAQRAKRKEQQKAVARTESSEMIARVMAARAWPVIDTRITPDYAENGIANALITRRGPNDYVVAVVFLVDLFCLGVKDVAIFYGPEASWKQNLRDQAERGPQLENISPELLRKIVEGSVAFARSFGIAPHRDWSQAAPIFGDIDASKCLTEVTYGRDGKPYFFAGPNDGPDRIRRILAVLNQHAGPGNFHFIFPIHRGGDDLGCVEALDDARSVEIT